MGNTYSGDGYAYGVSPDPPPSSGIYDQRKNGDDILGTWSWIWFRILFMVFLATLFVDFFIISIYEQGLSDSATIVTIFTCYLFLSYGFEFFDPSYSYACINPALTIMYLIKGYRLPWGLGLLMIIAQAAGSVLSELLVYGFAPVGSFLGTPFVGAGRSIYQAFGAEIVGTFMLGMVFCLIDNYKFATYSKNPPGERGLTSDLYPFKMFILAPFGRAAAATAATASCIGISGGIFDPFRYLWPAAFSGTIDGLGTMAWIAGPFIGGIVAGLFSWLFNLWLTSDQSLTPSEVGLRIGQKQGGKGTPIFKTT